MMIKSIPLNKLVPSQRNVRRSTDEQADVELRADIEARGLLQNLVVTSCKKPKGSFAVEAGGRRLRALKALASEGRIAKTHAVCCLVIEGGRAEAKEASLAENFQRLAMNPADECLAFGQLVEQGLEIEAIARRFGLTARFVEGRLRLANLAPAIFEALGSGEISLEIAKAYASSGDVERQAHVFEQAGRSYVGNHPDSIRRMMTEASIRADDRRALFVGEEAYVAAGGRVERDLFAEDSGTRWLDIAILERLAQEKLEALTAEACSSSGLGWVQPTLERWIGHELTDGLQRVEVERVPLTDQERTEVETLESEMEQLSNLIEDEEMGSGERAAADSKIRDLASRIDSILDKPPLLDDALRPEVGAFLMLDGQGRPVLDRSFYSRADMDCGVESPGQAGGAISGKPGDKPVRTGLSQRLADELAIQRRDVLAAHVAADPALALDLAIFLMADRETGYSSEKSGFSLAANPPQDPVAGFQTPDAPARLARAEAGEALDRSWADGRSCADRFDAFRALPEESRAAWLGHCVARTLEASLNLPGQRSCAFHDHLGRLLGIEVARWWRPTGANYFDRVPKSMALEALTEAGGAELAGRYSNARKAELAQTCERIFSGDCIAEAGIKEAALAWVPEAMRFAAAAPDPGEGSGLGDAGGDAAASGGGEGEEDPAVSPVEEAA
jgi:ParB family chromosome partitioning protein